MFSMILCCLEYSWLIITINVQINDVRLLMRCFVMGMMCNSGVASYYLGSMIGPGIRCYNWCWISMPIYCSLSHMPRENYSKRFRFEGISVSSILCWYRRCLSTTIETWLNWKNPWMKLLLPLLTTSANHGLRKKALELPHYPQFM